MLAVLAVAVVFFAGVSYAQENSPAPMPEKVRSFLDKLVGTWNFDGSSKGKNEIRWDSGKGTLIDNGQFQTGNVSGSWSAIWYWDGLSDDGVIVSWSGPTNRGISHGRLQGKVLSKTLMECQRTGVRRGKTITGKVQIEFQSPDQYTWRETSLVAGGEKQPDAIDVYTKTKGISREDFEEFCKLQEGAWVGVVPLRKDIPGVGKKGDKATAHYANTIIEDGTALIGRIYWPEGTLTSIYAYDETTKKIKCMEISPIFGIGNPTVHYSDRTWILRGSDTTADGTESEWTASGTYSDDGNTLTVSVSITEGGEKTELTDVWHRMNK